MNSNWPPMERNIAMELVRVTEAAALAAARFLGRGDKNLVDDAAVSAMRYVLGYIQTCLYHLLQQHQQDLLLVMLIE